ncbi:DUF4476 domain-containing protein [Hymenobacter sp. H14-R3]|uniref:DUF4476 domain-containing protein n=1 Tax=Hymenobacter sp. H14-R3 TaxID=3046308 RepID=UPI0024B98367|nr:DUF4476 domain-containing protein [Hymenobacter sp. H14-R3]MDJ0367877.1 DUF4476 domain-containing protein [Hymenobacter sp. H14-R3]
MNRLFTLVVAALLAAVAVVPALAAPPANLTITAERGQPFGLVLDGRLLTRPLARQVHVDLLQPGRHWAEFSVPNGYGPPLRYRTSVWLQPGLETDYVLVLRPYGPQLRQVGVLPLGRPGYGGPSGYYSQGYAPYGYDGQGQPPIMVPNQGGYATSPGYDPRSAPGNGLGGYNQPAPNYPGGGQPNGGYNAPNNPGPGYPGGYGNAPGGYPNQGPGNGGGYYPGSGTTTSLQPLAQGDAADLAQDLRQRPTETERLRTATEALAQSSLRADELTELLQAFTHDESRIELARFGYAHLSDPQNFSRVYGVLQSQSSVRALQQAVGLPQD